MTARPSPSVPRSFAARVRATLLVVLAASGTACDEPAYREVHVGPEPSPRDLGAEPSPRRRGRLRFSVAAMQSPRNTFGAYSRLFERMGGQLGVDVEFIQRRTYREVNELLATNQLDAAYVCTGGYLELDRRSPGTFEVLAVPEIEGKTTYESLVIVPASSEVSTLDELAGRRFAYTDELSLSGHAYVVYALRDMREDPLHFFASTVFTHSHDRSIEAVANGIVDGASVDGLIYDYRSLREREIEERTRVVHRSPPLGIMPIVAAPGLAPETRRRLRDVLLGLHLDDDAASALQVVGIHRFVAPPPGLYDRAAQVVAGAR